MAQGSKYYTVFFVPDDQRRMFTIKVRAGILRTLIGALVLFILGIAVLLFRTGQIAMQLQLVPYLRDENKRLKTENEQLHDLRRTVERMSQYRDYLERLALMSAVQSPSAPRTAVPVAVDTAMGQTEITVASGSAAGSADSSTQPPPDQYRQSIPYIWPVQGWVTRNYAADGPPTDIHRGIDIAAAQGRPIRSTAPGVVEIVAFDDYLGKTLTIRHKYGFMTRYSHCSQILVTKGQVVERGQTVATVGNTGQSSAPHLHYEILKNGKPVNPLRYIAE